MKNNRCFVIERRLQRELGLVRLGCNFTPKTTERLGVSGPSFSHDATVWLERGYAVLPDRRNGSWHFTTAAEISGGRRPRSIRDMVMA